MKLNTLASLFNLLPIKAFINKGFIYIIKLSWKKSWKTFTQAHNEIY